MIGNYGYDSFLDLKYPTKNFYSYIQLKNIVNLSLK